MAYEAKLNAKNGGKWGQMHPRIIAAAALVLEVGILSVFARIVAVGASLSSYFLPFGKRSSFSA
jgi:hypothetical protein